jgi:TetR/AcrR family transcriptional regulator, regulator of mycofactocin system
MAEPKLQHAVPKSRPGRPRTTSRDEVGRIALRLFVERGFEETTLEDVAAAVGVGRRTLFRYYDSKNDIVWGAFSEHLEGLRAMLDAANPAEPMMDVLRRVVVAFNDYGEAELPDLRNRMTLITTVPALQGHSMLRYGDWCAVIADFVAGRLDLQPDDLIPQVIANAALGTSMATYRHWIKNPHVDLLAELDRAYRLLAAGFDENALRSATC